MAASADLGSLLVVIVIGVGEVAFYGKSVTIGDYQDVRRASLKVICLVAEAT